MPEREVETDLATLLDWEAERSSETERWRKNDVTFWR